MVKSSAEEKKIAPDANLSEKIPEILILNSLGRVPVIAPCRSRTVSGNPD